MGLYVVVEVTGVAVVAGVTLVGGLIGDNIP